MAIIRETAIEYNRSARQWQIWPADTDYDTALIVGGVVAFPAGREGKRAAQLSALTNDAPDIAAIIESLIQRWPDNAPLIDRAIRAGFLVKNDHVRANREVLSSEKERYYQVRFAKPGGFYCTCADWENGRDVKFGAERRSHAPQVRPLGIVCKHALAVFIAGKLRMFTGDDDRREGRERAIDLQDQLVNRMVDDQLYGKGNY